MQEDTESLIETIQEYGEFFKVTSDVKACRDSKDNFLLSLSKDSKADFLITGDNDLLEMKSFESTKILTLSEFIDSHK